MGLLKKLASLIGIGASGDDRSAPRPEDSVVARQLKSVYDKDRAFQFYAHLMGSGDLVFDVGANLGNRVEVFLRTGANVVAFEPQKFCRRHLEEKFSGNQALKIEGCALGAEKGVATIYLSEAHTVSTLSTDWIEKAKVTNRFEGVEWNGRDEVPLETLDSMIEKYGDPAFVKIDVEDYEYEVLRGLTRPLKSLSLEFAAESLLKTIQCLDHMERLQSCKYQISIGESMEFFLSSWQGVDFIKQQLEELVKEEPLVWGEVYVRRSE